MRHLLDAHSLIWALDDPRKLGPRAIAILEDPDNELVISAGTIGAFHQGGAGKALVVAPIPNVDGTGPDRS